MLIYSLGAILSPLRKDPRGLVLLGTHWVSLASLRTPVLVPFLAQLAALAL